MADGLVHCVEKGGWILSLLFFWNDDFDKKYSTNFDMALNKVINEEFRNYDTNPQIIVYILLTIVHILQL